MFNVQEFLNFSLYRNSFLLIFIWFIKNIATKVHTSNKFQAYPQFMSFLKTLKSRLADVDEKFNELNGELTSRKSAM
jgi:hypothetical protein